MTKDEAAVTNNGNDGSFTTKTGWMLTGTWSTMPKLRLTSITATKQGTKPEMREAPWGYWPLKVHRNTPESVAGTMAVFNPPDNKMYCGSDGGIYVSSDLGDSWTSTSDELRIMQFYDIGLTTQDNDEKIETQRALEIFLAPFVQTKLLKLTFQGTVVQGSFLRRA